VAGDEYLLKLSCYIHLNPVWVAEWASRPIEERNKYLREYPRNTYQGYIGKAKLSEWITPVRILAMIYWPKREQPMGLI